MCLNENCVDRQTVVILLGGIVKQQNEFADRAERWRIKLESETDPILKTVARTLYHENGARIDALSAVIGSFQSVLGITDDEIQKEVAKRAENML